MPTSPSTSPKKSPIDALRSFVDEGWLAGAVGLVADRTRILSLEAVGMADIAGGIPMKTDNYFWIASMTKPMVATCLMMLVEEGKVSLDGAIEEYLPEFKELWLIAEKDAGQMVLRRPRRKVTVRDCLCHIAGMAGWSGVEVPYLDRVGLEERVRSYAMTPLNTEPGEKYAYTNMGTNTVGRIMEVVSGVAFEAFLQKRLFEPLGMAETTFWPSEGQVKRMAKAYKPSEDRTKLIETWSGKMSWPPSDRTRTAMPGGGLFSTATDVVKFCQMILCGGEIGGRRYVSADSIREMTRKQTGNLPDSYGLCWKVGEEGYGHSGAFGTNMTIEPKRGIITVYMVQHDGFLGEGGKAGDAFRLGGIFGFGRG